MGHVKQVITVVWVASIAAFALWSRQQGEALIASVPGTVTAHSVTSPASGGKTPVLLQSAPGEEVTLETAVPESVAAAGEADEPVYNDVALAEEPAAPEAPVLTHDPLDEESWDLNEFERLAAPDYETMDVLANLPVGSVVTPPEPLSIDEFLGTDQKTDPVNFANTPAGGIGTPFKMDTGDHALAGWTPLPAGQIQIHSTDFLDYDEENNQVYGQGRVTVRYGTFKLTADRVMIDSRLREIQAYGNVVLASPSQHVKAESMWFDAENYQGVSYKSEGHSGDFYILSDDPMNKTGTTIRQISENETVLKNSSFTTCDFPVPHYRFKAKEFTVLNNERVFARNVILYVREVPVLWLPYYTRALNESNPWGFSAGSSGDLGAFARVFYDYHHSYYTPSDVDDSLMVKSSDGHARVRLDYFSKRGFAQGLDYSYYAGHGKHFGNLQAYRLSDRERDIDGADSGDRSYVNWFHRTKISEELDWMVNLDWTSDPDLFYDVLDRVRSSSEWERGRIPERVAQTGFEWTADNFFAGIQVEIKDRIGRDRVSNFSEFRDGDFDFDRAYNDEDTFMLGAPGVGPDGFAYPNAGQYLDPASVADHLDRGVASSRFGRVSERLPHLRLATNRLRLGNLPLWYSADLNMFNNLDKGLNVVGTEDDSFVRGVDLYQSLSHLVKFNERYTLLTKVGLGAGIAEREDDSFNLDFPSGASFPYVYDGQVIDGQPLGLTFLDEDTFLVGKRKMSLSDVSPEFVYGDIDSRFNARITESVTGYLRYRFREGTDDHLGSFYERLGSRKTMDDLYAFRTPEHWIEGGLTHTLVDPRLTTNFNVGHNLQSGNDITAGEMKNYANLGMGYANLRNTLLVNAGTGFQTRQMRDPSDPYEFEQRSLTHYISGSYLPVHQRHWARLSTYFIQNAENDPLISDGDGNRDFDTRDEAIVDARIGKKIGTKYMMELRTRIRSRATDNQDTYVRLERDFHDMVAGVSVGVRQKERLSRSNEDATEDSFQVRFNMRFKPASQKGVLPVVTSTKLFDSGRSGFVAKEQSGIF